MSENVSSSVLYHFTDSKESLFSILKDGFFPHYCPEYTLDAVDTNAALEGRPPTRATLSVCFCDLPLSLIWGHLDVYGKYGIGLGKKWGLKNGVTPVFYTHPKAQTRLAIRRLTAKAKTNDDGAMGMDMSLFAAFTKPFEGPAWRKNKVQEKVLFYDEREWRYVPDVQAGDELFLTWADYANVAKRKALHEKFKRKYALKISPDDIEYLIVPDDSHVLKLAKFVRTLYEPDDATLVTTAIMTSDRIEADV